MKPQLSQREFDLLRNLIEDACGIALSEDKMYLIETRLSSLVARSGSRSFGEFYERAAKEPTKALRNQIVDAMTTNETLWFRDSAPWEALEKHILPELTQARPAPRKLRIWSAACSTGQEPYSLAMLIDDLASGRSGISPGRVEIVATDISPSALMIARNGRYDRISMNRGFTGRWQAFRDRYFEAKGPFSEISPRIRSRVRFESFNLQDGFQALGKFDLVLIRNVAIYFADSFKRDLFNRLAGTMNPGGYLLLGSAETMHGYSNRFQSSHFGRVTAYRSVAGRVS